MDLTCKKMPRKSPNKINRYQRPEYLQTKNILFESYIRDKTPSNSKIDRRKTSPAQKHDKEWENKENNRL